MTRTRRNQHKRTPRGRRRTFRRRNQRRRGGSPVKEPITYYKEVRVWHKGKLEEGFLSEEDARKQYKTIWLNEKRYLSGCTHIETASDGKEIYESLTP